MGDVEEAAPAPEQPVVEEAAAEAETAPSDPPPKAEEAASGDVPPVEAAEMPAEAPEEAGTGATMDTPAEIPAETPAEVPVEGLEAPEAEASAEVPAEAPAEVPAEASAEVPAEALAEVPAEAPAEAPAEMAAEAPAEAPAEVPAPDPVPEAAEASSQCEIVFVIMPEGFTHEATFPETTTVAAVKAALQGDLEIRPEHITLRFSGSTLANESTLKDAGLPTSGKSTIELSIEILKASDIRAPSGLPEALQVRVDHGPGAEASIYVVHIDNQAKNKKKPFLGGFRSQSSGAEFLHASMNTELPPNPDLLKAPRFHRETQTAVMRRTEEQTVRDSSTQMVREDVSLDHCEDRTIVPGPYFDAEQLATLRLQKAILLQSVMRGWFCRKLAQQFRDERDADEDERLRAELEETRLADQNRATEIERRMHPRTAEDFEVLYSELEAWRLQETQKINESEMSTAERKVALAQLLNKEVKLLQTIDRLKLSATAENKDDQIRKKLEVLAASKKWGMSDGSLKEVDTPFTVRARELMELYNGLSLSTLTVDERLDVLLHVKWTVKEFDCRLTRDLVDLIDREADMINRGRPEASLEGLRRRIQSLFLHFMETPEFNPEAARLEKVPRDFNARPYVKPILNDFLQTK